MDLIVKSMASLPIPEEMLKEMDVPGLLQSFKDDYDKLDDLKEAREAHESRNWLMRQLKSSEFKDAQQSAAELQASFSKKLGQLWLISHAQARLLDQQQQGLQEQQRQIKQQTQDIADANVIIAKQQERLGEQQDKLQTLIEDYFELKGLTMDGAKQLIQIAAEIKGTKSSLMAAFDAEHQVFLALQQRVEDCLQQQQAYSRQMDMHREQVGQAIIQQGEQFDARITAHRDDQDGRLHRLEEQFRADQKSLQQQQEQQSAESRLLLTALGADTKVQIKRVKRLAAVGLCGTGATILWLLWANRAIFGF